VSTSWRCASFDNGGTVGGPSACRTVSIDSTAADSSLVAVSGFEQLGTYTIRATIRVALADTMMVTGGMEASDQIAMAAGAQGLKHVLLTTTTTVRTHQSPQAWIDSTPALPAGQLALNVTTDALISFSSARSADLDAAGSIASREWSVATAVNSTAVSQQPTLLLKDMAAVEAVIAFHEPGTYDVVLVVTDNDGASVQTSTSVVASAAATTTVEEETGAAATTPSSSASRASATLVGSIIVGVIFVAAALFGLYKCTRRDPAGEPAAPEEEAPLASSDISVDMGSITPPPTTDEAPAAAGTDDALDAAVAVSVQEPSSAQQDDSPLASADAPLASTEE